MFHPLLRHRGLYAITNGPRADLLEAARSALQGGARVLQYRDKTDDHARRLQEARALAQLCTNFDVPLIINDDPDLAITSGASGVHLGEDDIGIAAARERLGLRAIIGVSCYDSLERAHDAVAAGADYLAFGAFFPSSTKPHARRATLELLREAKVFGLPLVAIGGITTDNGGSLIAAGVDYLAAVSAIFDARNIRAATQRFTNLFQTHSP